MNHTENFNLGLPLVTEKYDVNVFNTNNTIIDETLTHVNEKTNPHEVTAAQIGLGNVDNTSDATKPVSTPQAQAIAQAVAAEATRARAAEEANADAIANLEGMIPNIATTTTPGIVKPDGTTITVEEDGTISAVQATIDSALSTTSTNAVQNAVITNALNTKANQATTYTKTEVDNLMSAFETNIDWKEAVATYADIATTYPNPVDGWTVNVKDTDYTYRYNGTSWIVISANAIPDATTSVKGLMTPAMVTKLEGIEAGAQVNTVTGVKGDAESSYRVGDINITKSDIGLGNVPNVATNDQAPTFTQASTRTNIVSGETLSILFGKIMKFFNDLKIVAFSGSYNDLTNKPTIGNANLTIQKNGVAVKTFSANATEDVSANITVPTKTSELTNDSGFITSAALPTVNNATLTIQKNGTAVQTFTANQDTDATANITVPTKVSELTNDSGYTTNVGTVTSVATGAGLTGGTITGSGTLKAKLKSETKSTLTAADKGSTSSREYAVGLDASGNLSVNVPWENNTYTVNNGTLTIQKNGTNVQTFTANQSSNATANITVPTKVSELTNDSGYTTNTGTVTSVKVGNTAYNPTSGVVSLPAYPTNTDTHRPINVNGTQTLGNNTTALNLKNGSNVTITGSGGDVTIAATDTNTHRPIQVNGTEILGNNTTALNLKAGSNVTVTNSSGTVTIAASDSSRITSQISQVGSDAASSAGWYKVCSGSLTGYSNVSLIFAVHNTADYNAGILTFDLRCDNGTSLTVKKFGWLVRYGYTLANFIVNTSGNNWAIYQNITRSQYYRDTWTVLQESSTNGKTASYTLNNSTTKESSTPTATATSVDLATANYANSAGAVAWGNVSSKPSYYDAKAIKSITRSGTTFTYTCLDNTTGTFTQQDNNTWNAMVGATSSANGSVGYVNAVPPKDGYNTKFLRADGSWQVPSGTATVNNGTLTIQKNGTNVQTFTANQSGNATANITVPTKTSELTNDSGYITSSAVTGVKGNSESSYRTGNVNITATNIGLGNVGNFKAVSTVASQGLTDTEKSNARANIGAGTSSFSGSYNDLTNKPTIPTVNNGTLTIQKNGTNVQTFTANQSSNATANITVPTKVSELTNDSGYTTNTGTVTSVKVGTTSYSPSSGVVSLPAYPTVNNATLTIQQNGTSKATFTANSSSAATANIITDTWTSTATVSSSGTVAFSGLNDSYGYDLYCQDKLITIKSVAKSGSGTSTTLTYTVDGAATGDVCKLRILK